MRIAPSVLGAGGNQKRLRMQLAALDRSTGLVMVIGEASFFAAGQMRVMLFPLSPASKGSKGRQIPALGKICYEKVRCRGRGLTDSESWMAGSINQQNGSALGGQDPGKQTSGEPGSGDQVIESPVHTLNAWRTGFHGEHRVDRTSCVPSCGNRVSGIRHREGAGSFLPKGSQEHEPVPCESHRLG